MKTIVIILAIFGLISVGTLIISAFVVAFRAKHEDSIADSIEKSLKELENLNDVLRKSIEENISMDKKSQMKDMK